MESIQHKLGPERMMNKPTVNCSCNERECMNETMDELVLQTD